MKTKSEIEKILSELSADMVRSCEILDKLQPENNEKLRDAEEKSKDIVFLKDVIARQHNLTRSIYNMLDLQKSGRCYEQREVIDMVKAARKEERKAFSEFLLGKAQQNGRIGATDVMLYVSENLWDV